MDSSPRDVLCFFRKKNQKALLCEALSDLRFFLRIKLFFFWKKNQKALLCEAFLRMKLRRRIKKPCSARLGRFFREEFVLSRNG
jgi:hypothetical protein